MVSSLTLLDTTYAHNQNQIQIISSQPLSASDKQKPREKPLIGALKNTRVRKDKSAVHGSMFDFAKLQKRDVPLSYAARTIALQNAVKVHHKSAQASHSPLQASRNRQVNRPARETPSPANVQQVAGAAFATIVQPDSLDLFLNQSPQAGAKK